MGKIRAQETNLFDYGHKHGHHGRTLLTLEYERKNSAGDDGQQRTQRLSGKRKLLKTVVDRATGYMDVSLMLMARDTRFDAFLDASEENRALVWLIEHFYNNLAYYEDRKNIDEYDSSRLLSSDERFSSFCSSDSLYSMPSSYGRNTLVYCHPALFLLVAKWCGGPSGFLRAFALMREFFSGTGDTSNIMEVLENDERLMALDRALDSCAVLHNSPAAAGRLQAYNIVERTRERSFYWTRYNDLLTTLDTNGWVHTARAYDNEIAKDHSDETYISLLDCMLADAQQGDNNVRNNLTTHRRGYSRDFAVFDRVSRNTFNLSKRITRILDEDVVRVGKINISGGAAGSNACANDLIALFYHPAMFLYQALNTSTLFYLSSIRAVMLFHVSSHRGKKEVHQHHQHAPSISGSSVTSSIENVSSMEYIFSSNNSGEDSSSSPNKTNDVTAAKEAFTGGDVAQTRDQGDGDSRASSSASMRGYEYRRFQKMKQIIVDADNERRAEEEEDAGGSTIASSFEYRCKCSYCCEKKPPIPQASYWPPDMNNIDNFDQILRMRASTIARNDKCQCTVDEHCRRYYRTFHHCYNQHRCRYRHVYAKVGGVGDKEDEDDDDVDCDEYYNNQVGRYCGVHRYCTTVTAGSGSLEHYLRGGCCCDYIAAKMCDDTTVAVGNSSSGDSNIGGSSMKKQPPTVTAAEQEAAARAADTANTLKKMTGAAKNAVVSTATTASKLLAMSTTDLLVSRVERFETAFAETLERYRRDIQRLEREVDTLRARIDEHRLRRLQEEQQQQRNGVNGGDAAAAIAAIVAAVAEDNDGEGGINH